MASSTSNLDQLTVNQSQKEVTVNAYLDAASPASSFGRRASTTTALTWGYYGGTLIVSGLPVVTANGTIALAASSTNYVEVNVTTGVVSSNTTGFTAGSWRCYTVVTGVATVTSYTDHRVLVAPYFNGVASKSVAGAADVSLTNSEAACEYLTFTGAITANITVFAPNRPWRYVVFNSTTGAFTLTFSTLSGGGIVVGSGLKATIYSDGNNMIRITADI